MLIKSIIVEDEPIARKFLHSMCKNIDQLKIIQLFENAEDALSFLTKDACDLIFLDVEMPGMSGIEMLGKLEVFPQIIMTTSNPDYAADAFEYDVADFLIKPISLPKLKRAIERVSTRLNNLFKIAETSFKNEIYIKADKSLIRIPVDDIFFIESVGDYVRIITDKGNYMVYSTLTSLDQRLDHPRLLKIHRSYIVNLGRIKSIVDNSILLENEKLVPISRAFKPFLVKSINII